MPDLDRDLNGEDEPCYVISVAARMVGMHAQTLRSMSTEGVSGG